MLFLLAIRNLRHSLVEYALAVSGVALAVFVVVSALTGVTLYRRIGVQPMREFIGGDVMLVPASMQSDVEGSSLSFDFSRVKPMDPRRIIDDLRRQGRTFSSSLAVPAYLYTGSPRPAVLVGRSTGGSELPHMTTDEGRYLDPEDDASARMVARVSTAFQKPGDTARFRVARYDSSSATFDLARGLDLDFEIVGLSHRAVGTDAIIVPLPFLQSATGCPLVTWIGVDVPDYTQLASVSASIKASHPELLVLTAEQMLAALDTEGSKLQQAALPLMSLVLLVGCVAMFNTCSLMARLRRREAALMKVLGLSSTVITATLIAEGSMTTVIGVALGYVAGAFVGAGAGGVVLAVSWLSFQYVIVVLFVVVLAAVLPPAIWLARHPAWEVIRNA